MAAPVVLNLPALHPAQRNVRNTRARFKILRCGRRFGKTVLAAVACVEVALGVAWWHWRCHPDDEGRPRPGRAMWVPPTYKIAKIGWRVLYSIAVTLEAAGLAVDIRRADWEILFPGGGHILVRSADSPAGLRGDDNDLIIMEEAAHIREDVWEAELRPTLIDRRGEAWFITTPNGYNWFYEHERRHLDADGWAVFEYDSSANPHLSADEIADLAADMSPLKYQQEVLAQYVSGEATPIQAAWFRYHDEHDDADGGLVLVGDQPDGWRLPVDQAVRFATVDLAASLKESADYTVIASVAADRQTGRLAVLDLVRDRIAAPDLIPAVRQQIDRWDLRYAAIERVGYQLAAVQTARAEGLPVRELKADRDKVSRSIPLQVKMEAGLVSFPRRAPWLRTVETELLTFPVGAHDDIVDALAYAALEAGRMPRYAVA